MNRNPMRGWTKAGLVLLLGSVLTAGGVAAPAAAGGQDRGHHRGWDRDRGWDHHRGWDRGWDRDRDRGGEVDYVALGDSYASGFGGGPLLDACGRTAEGYPALLDALRRVDREADVTCAGATASSTPPGAPAGPVDLPEQIAALRADGSLNRGTDLVTVTIGGNDVQFGAVVQACIGPVLPETCAPAIASATAYAQTTLTAQLQESLRQIRELAPRAELVLVGYPYLFEAGTAGPLSPEAVALFSQGTDALNAVLAGQVQRGETFVDVTDEFAGHGVGSADPWIIALGSEFQLHPNATGYREGYLAAITADVHLGHGKGHCRGRR